MQNLHYSRSWVHVYTSNREGINEGSTRRTSPCYRCSQPKKNIELQEEIEKLNDKLENQEAESERKLEEKLQQLKEEDSWKIQTLRDEFMAALKGSRQTPLAQVKDI